MLPLHKPSNVLFLWSGLFIDGPEECPGFCVLFCGWWRLCLHLFNFFPLSPLLYHQSPSGKGFIYSVCFDRHTLPAARRWNVGGRHVASWEGLSVTADLQGLGCSRAEVLRLPHRWQLVPEGALVLGKAAAIPNPAFLFGSGSCLL